MSIVRTSHNRENPYVMLNKSILEDGEISWAAKGLWAYLMSRPDDWKVSVAHLSTIYCNKGGGERAIYSLLDELIELGYCTRSQGKNEKGEFKSYEYVITEFKNKVPHRSQPHAASLHAGESPPTNKVSILINEEQQQAAPAAAVFSCLTEESIPSADKVWLTEHYDEETIRSAIKWAHHPKTKITTTLAQSLKWACKNKPEIPKDEDEIQSENKKIASQYRKYCEVPGTIFFEVLNKSVEIGMTGNFQPAVIEYSDRNFIGNLTNAMKRYGIRKKTSKVKKNE